MGYFATVAEKVMERIILALNLMLDTCADEYQRQTFASYCMNTVQYAISVDDANRLITEKVLALANNNQKAEAAALLKNNGFVAEKFQVAVTVILDVEDLPGLKYKSDRAYYVNSQVVAALGNIVGTDDGRVKITSLYDWSGDSIEVSGGRVNVFDYYNRKMAGTL